MTDTVAPLHGPRPTRRATAAGMAPAWSRLRWAAWFYALAWAIHTADHLRRGLGVVSSQVTVLGLSAAVLQVVAIVLVLRRNRYAPAVALAIGIPDGIGIAAVHLLPHWSAFSDAFPGAHHTGVTGFSWFAAIVEVLGALVFAAAGWGVFRRQHPTPA